MDQLTIMRSSEILVNQEEGSKVEGEWGVRETNEKTETIKIDSLKPPNNMILGYRAGG